MIRVIFNDGIMEQKPIEVLELPAYEKLSSQLWRRINDRERMASTLATCRQVLSQWPRPDPEDTIKRLRELLGLQKEEI